ncbi:hypothetical protein TNCT_24891 [Trichonephila clavata]|uniref:Uncharacterized protein n=1 Tax=Trichonephila clavata TaxID=2740835 RepID=A0A8X6GBD4_TRICU|nr:hypothetical protein TNCT_24891 [Trichonephila clavata]
MHGLQPDGALVGNLKHGIWKGDTVQELKSRVTQRQPLIQILRAIKVPGHGRLSVQVGFQTFCSYAPNVGAMTTFGHPMQYIVRWFGRLVEAETGKRY